VGTLTRFLHVSTGVYGSLGQMPLGELAYRPNSPRRERLQRPSGALVRGAYGMPALITNCSNNYGPYQFPEKVIPLFITHALEDRPVPLYGDGMNVRDWLHVDDHAKAVALLLTRGVPGETYNIGGGNERNNRDVVGLICDAIDRAFAADAKLAARFPSCPAAAGNSCRALISFVTDRPGHDHRYAIDASKLESELGNRSHIDFSDGIDRTVHWYLDHAEWWRDITSGVYKAWIERNYDFRSFNHAKGSA
jgi:dTDP-glucose 4,6-dehydratase